MTGHIPHGHTARRLQWYYLPPMLRRAIEQQCGSPVVADASCDAGFTPGMASVLTCADGSRHFVKAASVRAQRAFAHSYAEEARHHTALPEGVPAPALHWTLGVTPDAWHGEWVVLGFEYVDARAPHRPWTEDDLEIVLATLAVLPKLLTPPPMPLASIGEEFADWPSYWRIPAVSMVPHAERAAALAERFESVCAGESVVHTDLRDDNLLLTPDGRVLICDWNWPVAGAPWIDPLLMLIGPRGDGLDVDAVIAAHPLLSAVPAEHIDVLLALVAGYFLKSAAEPVPPTSPFVREAQRWQGEVCFDWLRERRGWT